MAVNIGCGYAIRRSTIGKMQQGTATAPRSRGRVWGVFAAAALTLLAAPQGQIAEARRTDGGACDVSVMISGAFNAPYQVLAGPFEKRRHRQLCTANGPSMGETLQAIPNRLARGEPADVVILARAALDALVARGAVVRGSEVDLVRSSIAMAVKKGAPKPDISTGDKFRQALLDARAIA